MSALPARAQRAVRIHLEVADLGGEAVRAAQDLSSDHDPAAHAGAQRHEQEVVDTLRGAVRELGERGHVRVVVDDDRTPGRVGEQRPHG